MTQNETQLLSDEVRSPQRLLLPSLTVASFTMSPPMVLLTLLMIDIGQTFDLSLGVVSQLETVSLTVAAITALLMGVWSIRFNHKSLLLIGLTLLNLSALGCFFAFNFSMMVLAYALTGLGYTMIQPMTYTLIGEYFPSAKRTSAIGWLSAGMASAFLIGSLFISDLAGRGDWRLPFLVFILPVSLLGLFMVKKWVPAQKKSIELPKTTKVYREGFKKIFDNQSAIACLVGTALIFAGWQAILIYSVSFFRDSFLVSIESSGPILFSVSLSYILGTLVISRFVKQYGKKPLTVVTAVLAGLFISSYMNTPPSDIILLTKPLSNIWLAFTLCCLGSLFFGMLVTISTSLTLEQVPQFRGTMMSMHVAAWDIGAALGTGVGGLILDMWGYDYMGLTLGTMILTSALVFYLIVRDPTRNTESSY